MRLVLPAAFAAALLAFGPIQVQAAFTSGSDGSDGALVFTADPGTSETVVLFDPTSFPTALDPDGDGVYHFTTITIPANVTVRLRGDKCGTLPLHWLATGDVIIAGTLDLSATDATPAAVGSLPSISIPGPGGFPGGLAETPNSPAQAGFGPGGGQPPTRGGSFARQGYPAFGNTTYGNAYLMPLVGGSGGSGSAIVNGFSTSGGAGGGAILIASNTSITLNGAIRSLGGQANTSTFEYAAGGSGGAVRLMAPVFTGTGTVDVNPTGGTNGYYGGAGWIRVEAVQNSFRGQLDGEARQVTLFDGSPVGATDARTKLSVVSINGTALPAFPGGTFAVPDAVVTSGAVSIVARVANPPASGVRYVLYLYSETEFLNGDDIVVTPGPVVDGAQEVTFSATVPSGFTRGFVAMVPDP